MNTPLDLPARDPLKSFILNYAPIFSKLDTLDKNLIIQKSRIVEYKKGDIIYQQNDSPDAFNCIISGRVKIFTNRQGKEDGLEHLNCGKYFGVISLLTGEPHSVTARATNDSKILRISKDDFHLILEKIPQLAIDLSRTLSRRLRKRDTQEKKIFESNILSVFSLVGHKSSTMYAANLALSLKKETHKSVILINVSRNPGDIYRSLGLEAKHNGQGEAFPAIRLTSVFPTDYSVTSAILEFESLGISILNIIHDSVHTEVASNLNTLLTHLTGDYHYIIVSLASAMDEVLLCTLKQSDIAHIITDYKPSNIACAKDLIDELYKTVNYPQEKIKVIMNDGPEDKDEACLQAAKSLNYRLYANLPSLKGMEDAKSGRIVLDDSSNNCAKTIRRISRELGDVRVGLALSGGAALGLAHIGVLKALEKENIPIDMVAGSSMGAFVGAFWVSGLTAKQIEEIVLEYNDDKKKVKHLLLDPCFPRMSFLKGRRIRELLEKHIGNKTFKDVKCPFKVVACNISKRQEHIFDSGSIVDAVMASIAIPGVFYPTRINGDLLVDGGIIESLPIGVLVRSGIKKIIAVNVLPSPESIAQGREAHLRKLEEEKRQAEAKGFFSKVSYNIRKRFKDAAFPTILDIIVNSIQTMEYVVNKNNCQEADVVINIDIAGVDWFEFYKSAILINKGEEETIKSLGAIKSIINE